MSLRLLERLGARGMSDEDDDVPHNSKDPRPIRTLVWRGGQVTGVLRALDEFSQLDRDYTQRRPGPGPLERVRQPAAQATVASVDERPPVPGLWKNAYRTAWLQAQPPSFRLKLDVDDEDFDFTAALGYTL